MVSGIVILLMTPLVVYGWIALTADRDARMDAALARNQATAQLLGMLFDRQCEAISSTLTQYGRRLRIVDAFRRRDGGAVNPTIQELKATLPDLDFVVAYDVNGEPFAGNLSTRLAPRHLKHSAWAQHLIGHGAGPSVRTARTADGSALVLWSPVRDNAIVGSLVAGISSQRIDSWLSRVVFGDGTVYVVDEEGHTIAGTCSPLAKNLPLEGYPPLQYAFMSQNGALSTQSPDSLEDHLVAYSLAKTPHCAILVTQPMEAAFATTNFFAMRLSVLFLPVFALVVTGALSRLRTTRRLEEMAGQLEEQNVKLRLADRAKSDFLAQVSHDLRTPLAAMRVSLSGLIDDEDAWDEQHARQSLNVVNGEVDQLTARVQGLLEMARLEAGVGGAEREPADLTDVVASAVERMEPLLRGRRIDESFPDEPMMVECDHGQIEKVMMNLLENAVKYSPGGTTIHLRGETRGGDALVTVCDEGAGFAPGDEERVFEKFYRGERTRAVRGTGLGLSICRAIIEGHGGHIGARPCTAEAGGAEFWFTLPLLTLPEEKTQETKHE
jgi:signal transduction histidine kinase